MADWNFPESKVTTPRSRSKRRNKLAHELLADATEYMSDEHKEYVDALFAGEQDVDALKLLEILAYYEVIYTGVAMKKAIEGAMFSKDLAAMLGELRQTAKELEIVKASRRKEEEKAKEEESKEKVFDPTDTFSRFDSN